VLKGNSIAERHDRRDVEQRVAFECDASEQRPMLHDARVISRCEVDSSRCHDRDGMEDCPGWNTASRSRSTCSIPRRVDEGRAKQPVVKEPSQFDPSTNSGGCFVAKEKET
jgi:hypothetical protein